ncbi:MAG: NUDIX domain-containing protein [Caldilineaceae bacterium SB0664_bin_27]|uniref:NUDIX domain-containing protein n=1 Tax=Caldilineaceae bacterium SB0664_bin_27 TaxID=2605260 RepID=A0A6B0Z188_9CHLR|nr:NUDIX domain-containing protein [Caldilineaceae bacterium SB0664_bin_27]
MTSISTPSKGTTAGHKLKAFLRGRTPLAEERLNWSGGGKEFVQTRATYALNPSDSPPLSLVTSVRAVLTRGPQVMVMRDPDGEHIVPGGRLDDGEGLLEALRRELLEETGWKVRGEPALIGLFHYHIHSPKPAGHRYPYPDFLQLLYRAEADRHFPEAMEVDGFELDAQFRSRDQVNCLSLSSGEFALLKLVDDSQ